MKRLIAASAAFVLFASGVALGHSELVSADPAEGATVEGPLFPIVLTFSEPLAEGSKAEIAVAGAMITILPDVAEPTRMAYEPGSDAQPFEPGGYTIQWTSVADDGDILRGTITFTVAAPPPSPSPSPTLEPSATPAPTPNPSPSPTPVPSAEPGDGSEDSSAAIIPIIAALVFVGAAAWWLMRRRPSAP